MAVTYYLVAVFFFFLLKVEVQAVQFNFSTNQLAISEGGDLPSQLFIVKTGQHQGNITVSVSLTSTVPNAGDYTVNQDQYVFSNETFTLPIGIQLVRDRSGEGIESFDLTLAVSSQTSTSISADVVFPGQVTVVIIDDDLVVIGFLNDNSSVVITEGGPSQTICLEVKEEGLALDPHDIVPLSIEIDSEIPVITVELGTNQLVFQRTLIRCTTISATDNNISEGSRSSHIVIGEGIPESTVPIEVYPSRIPLIILDDDEIIFIISSNAILVASEGERVISVIKLRKSGNTLLTYNVTLEVQPLTSSASLEDLNIPTVLIFDPSTYEIDIQIEIYVPDDVVFSEERREFSASISVEAINATGTLTSVEGGPIGITVFDNDFEVGFTESRTNITKDLRRNVCVRIFNLGSEDIDPTKLLPLELSISPNNNKGAIELTLDRVILNALSPIVCFDVILSADTAVNDGASFTIQLTTMISQNNIALRQQFIMIDILQLTTAMPSQGQGSLSSSGVAAIMISILLILSISINVIMLLVIILYYKRIKESDNDGGDNQDAKRNVEGSGVSNNNTRQSMSPEPLYMNANPQQGTTKENSSFQPGKNSSTMNLILKGN